MKKYLLLILILVAGFSLYSETLFEVKDSANNKVLDVSTDGLRIFNEGDTLMVISADAIRANIGTTQKGLSRSFSVTTTSSVKGKGLINALEVDAESASMTSPQGQYTDFSPENIFLGLNAGLNVYSGFGGNVFIGNDAGKSGTGISFSTFIGDGAGENTTTSASNIFIGNNSGNLNTSGGFNTYIGWGSGINNNGDNNVFIGPLSGWNTPNNVSDNIFIGYFAGATTSGSGNILLGNGIGNNDGVGSGNILINGIASGDNKLNIGNLITGDLAAKTTNINGTLSVTGNSYVGGTFTTGNDATINGDAHIINSTNAAGQKGLVIDTDGEGTDIPLRIRTNSSATGWTDDDTKFVVWGDGKIEAKYFQIGGGSSIGMTQAGILTVGTNSSANYKAVTLTFPTAFSTIPKINVTPVNESGINDIYSVTVRNITTTNCVVLICRVDSTIKTWGQNLKADWYAWE